MEAESTNDLMNFLSDDIDNCLPGIDLWRSSSIACSDEVFNLSSFNSNPHPFSLSPSPPFSAFPPSLSSSNAPSPNSHVSPLALDRDRDASSHAFPPTQSSTCATTSSKISYSKLVAQRGYDRRRRKLQRTLYETLREVLKCQKTSTDSKSAMGTEEIQAMGDAIAAGEDEIGEAAQQIRKKQRRRKGIDEYSTRDLITAASSAIRSLSAMRGVLEQQLSSLSPSPSPSSSTLSALGPAVSNSQIDEDEPKHACTYFLPPSSESSSSSEHDSLDPSPISLSNAEATSAQAELSQLLEAIFLVHRQYTATLNAVRTFESHFLPRAISDFSSWLSEHTVVGMDGVFIVASHRKRWEEDARNYVLHSLDLDSTKQRISQTNNRGSIIGWREANTNQLHSIAALCSNGRFQYRVQGEKVFPAADHQNFEATTSMTAAIDMRKLSTHDVVQMIRDSSFAPKSFSSLLNSPAPKPIDEFLTPPAEPTPSFLSSSAPSSFSFASSSPSSSLASLDVEDVVMRHPLASCSLSFDSFHTYLEILERWVLMGKERFEEHMDRLRPVAMKLSPEKYVHKVLPICALEEKGYSLRESAFSALVSTNYETMKEFYLLFSGRVSMITVHGEILFPGLNRFSRVVTSVFLIREPNSGLPLASVVLPLDLKLEAGEKFELEESRVRERELTNQQKFDEQPRLQFDISDLSA